MRLNDLMTNAGATSYAEVALILFLASFLGIAWWVFRPSSGTSSIPGPPFRPFRRSRPSRSPCRPVSGQSEMFDEGLSDIRQRVESPGVIKTKMNRLIYQSGDLMKMSLIHI